MGSDIRALTGKASLPAGKVTAKEPVQLSRPRVKKWLRLVAQQPDFAAALSLLGLIDAGLGQKEAAINEGRRACELVPMAKDAVDGVAYAANLGANLHLD